MAGYLVEMRINGAGPLDLQRVARSLRSARARLLRSEGVAPTLLWTMSGGDGRLAYVVEASSLEMVRRLVRTALLPPARIRSIQEPSTIPGEDGLAV